MWSHVRRHIGGQVMADKCSTPHILHAMYLMLSINIKTGRINQKQNTARSEALATTQHSKTQQGVDQKQLF